MVGLTGVEPRFHQRWVLAVLGVPWVVLRYQPFDGPGFGMGVGGFRNIYTEYAKPVVANPTNPTCV